MSQIKSFISIFFLFVSVFVFFPLVTLAESIPDKSHSSLSVNSSVPADGKTTAIITITLQDASGNPVAGHRVSLEDSSNSGATITSISDTTDASGHALFSIRSTKPQKDNINVTDITSNTTFYNLGEITFTSEGCFDSAPGSTPRLTSAIANNSTQIKLSWTDAANPVTRYLLSYGTSSGQYIYGNPNVGGQGTTTYTVSSLTPGRKYYFVVQAINGCMPGNFSNELAATPGEVIVASPTQLPSVEPSPSANTQTDISPTSITHAVDNVSTNTSSLTEISKPTISSTPIQNSSTNNARATILLIASIVVVVLGSIGNILFWKNEQKKYEVSNPLHYIEEDEKR